MREDPLIALNAWLQNERDVRSVVLFGSRARDLDSLAPPDRWSDVDLHVVTSSPKRLIETDWRRVFPKREFCLQVLRPATGGVRKLTVLFFDFEADIVLVPLLQMRLASVALKWRLYRYLPLVADALNAFSNPLRYGYRFLKGEHDWGKVYTRVVRQMEGYRLSNIEVEKLAIAFLYDQFYVLRKLQRGELVAAQRVLHRGLVETNVMLMHELRLRRGEFSIQQARRVEHLYERAQLEVVQVSARLDRAELASAVWHAANGLARVMAELLPTWKTPSTMQTILNRVARELDANW